MPLFSRTTWLTWLGLALPVMALLGALVTVTVSLNQMADEANRIEGRLTSRSAEAAVRSNLQHLAETHADYAVWDDAVRALYGAVDQGFVEQNYRDSTSTATLFDTVYLLGENGADVFAFRRGEQTEVTAAEAFGASLAVMAAKLPQDGRTAGVETGIVSTRWGLEELAVGPVVPSTEAMTDLPKRARLLIVGRALDEAAVGKISQDYVIPGLHLAAADASAGVPLTDPTGAVVGRLAWDAPALGTVAGSRVGPTVYLMFGVLAVVFGGLALLLFRTYRRSEEVAERSVTQSRQLAGALASVPHGICMFDAEKRLVFCNARYAAMYKLPHELTQPGTTLQAIFDYRLAAGNAPADFPNYVSHQGIEWTVGGPLVFEFVLDDGRAIRLSHLSMEGGSYIAVHEDVTAVAHAEKALIQVARRDVLTDLPNRIGFRESLGNAVKASAAAGNRLAVLYLDLDRFKGVNETLGAAAGDALLVMVADRLRSVVGADDMLARLGGDSFAIAQTDVEQPEGARRLAQAVADVVGAPFDLDTGPVTVGVSTGIALAAYGSDAEHLQKNAELALYWVKGHGRGRYQFFDPAMEAAVQSRHQIAAGLRKAIERDQLEVHYQPIVSLISNTIVGFEALLRWRHPDLGYVPPAEFIPVAEEAGLILEIGEWVVRRACADAAKWPRGLHVAVNLSSIQFKDPHLATTIFGALAAAQLAAGRLELEITESVLLEDNRATVATLRQLHEFGVKIAMDDFGTGYSSLSYLRSFPFDKIKIDQSFVRDITTSADSMAIVRAVIGLGAEFGVTTVAEGVETAEQLAILREAGCNEVQGFCFSEARPVDELDEFLLDTKIARPAAA
jgi:diguanylate cyclase (GGDEF)-like protein